MTPDYTPVHSGGAKPFTSQASAAIACGQMVMVSGNGTVAVATIGAGTRAFGLALMTATDTNLCRFLGATSGVV